MKLRGDSQIQMKGEAGWIRMRQGCPIGGAWLREFIGGTGMGKKDLKADLMELLREDTDLRQIIREICNSKTVEKFSSRDSRGITDYLPNWLEKSKKDYAAENEKLRERLAEKEKTVANMSETIEVLRQEAADSERLLSEAEQKNDRLRMELAAKESQCQELAGRNQELEHSVNNFREAANSLRQEATRLKRENEEQAQMLSQRFAEGWELFCAYQNVSAQSKRLLGGVFVKADDFTSFICGGAQDSSLGRIWDVIKSCLVQGSTKDADILWDIFEYAVELVNSAKTERIYEIMDAKPGAPFDLEVHALAPGSRAQGNVQEVYLLGYRNVYAGRVERKSIVCL